MRIQFGLRDLFPVRVEFCQSTVPVPDVDLPACGVVSEVIGVIAVFNGFEELERTTVKYFDCAVFGTRDK